MLVGTTLGGRYRVTRELGHGGMGAVYEAVHERLGKRVAIKVLLDAGANEAAMARFEQEARLASSIGNEHIVDVVDIDRAADGRTYIVMELLEGESLAQLITAPMPERRIVNLGAQAARALAAAHAKGVVHRDIKPENLFVIDRGGDFVKIVDFGISKLVGAPDANLTRTGAVIGTAAYMSPEQARGDDLDARVDIYALGVVLYQAATGRLPFEGDNVLKVLNLVVSTDAVPPRTRRPDLSAAFERIVMTAMAPRRDDRFATAAALADALDRLVDGIADAPTAAMPAATAAMPPAPVATAPTIPAPAIAGPIGTAPTTPTPAIHGPIGAAPTVATPASTPSPVATPTASPAATRRVRWLLGAVAVIAAGIVAAVIVVASRGGESRTVEVEIHTTPEGAYIFDQDRLLGTTPLKHRFAREDRLIQLTAQMAGFDVACFSINPADESDPVPVRMPEPGTGCGNSATRPVPR